MAEGRQLLKARRSALGLTQEDLARAAKVPLGTYRDWEQGRTVLHPAKRPGLAGALRVTLSELDTYFHDGGTAPNGHSVPAWLDHLASLEQGAAELAAFEPLVVHGLLQTSAYATAVERADVVPRSPEGVAERVRIRMARQRVLYRQPDPLQLSVLLDESVLYRPAGGSEVMAEQLDHLAAMSARPNVTVRVLPLNAGTFSAAFGSFTVLTKPEVSTPYMACVEDRCGGHYLDRRPDIEAHIYLFDRLVDLSLSPDETVELINRTRKERYR